MELYFLFSLLFRTYFYHFAFPYHTNKGLAGLYFLQTAYTIYFIIEKDMEISTWFIKKH